MDMHDSLCERREGHLQKIGNTLQLKEEFWATGEVFRYALSQPDFGSYVHRE